MLHLDDVLLILSNLEEILRDPRRFMAKLTAYKYCKFVSVVMISSPLVTWLIKATRALLTTQTILGPFSYVSSRSASTTDCLSRTLYVPH